MMALISESGLRVSRGIFNKLLCSFLLAMILLAGCSQPLNQPSIAVLLPEQCNTPDGMVLAPDGNIYLSCPNTNNDKHPAKIMKITPNDRLEEFFVLPPHPETGKACPLGIDIGPDGNFTSPTISS